MKPNRILDADGHIIERDVELFDYLEPPGRPILETMLHIYGGLLDEIVRRRYDVFSRRVELGGIRKLFLAARSVARHKWRSLFALAQHQRVDSTR